MKVLTRSLRLLLLTLSVVTAEEGSCSADQSQKSGDNGTCKNNVNPSDTFNFDKDYDTTQQQAIIDWVTSSGGKFNSAKQEFRRVLLPTTSSSSSSSSSDTSCGDSSEPASYVGVFATQDIEKGELLVQVPWECVITGWDDRMDGMGYFFCGSIQKLVNEMRLGDKSFFAPYTNYIKQQPRGKLPTDWSDAGKMLLLNVLHDENEGHHGEPIDLPPYHVVEMLDVWRQQCRIRVDHENQEDMALQELAALEHLLRSDDENLVPLYDLYNHANGERLNAAVKVEVDDKQTIRATRDIKAGEQIHISYSRGAHLSEGSNDYYSTADFLRDYGFVEPMPQRWVFEEGGLGLGFDVMEANNNGIAGELKLQWLDWVEWRKVARKPKYLDHVKRFFRRQFKRLEEAVGPMLDRVESRVAEKSCRKAKGAPDDDDDLPTPAELATIRQFSSALQTAIGLAIDNLDWSDECTRGKVVAGMCDKSFRDLRVVHGPREPEEHETFPTYNMDIYPEAGQKGWEEVEFEDSSFQEIGWLKRQADDEGNMDVCFLLDGMAQTCSNYSPHYHEIFAHFPTRYLEDVKRVAIIGGGDTKMLYEFMKYNRTLELLVHLELDQKVVRKSFKHFASQPHFDDERVEWWFGDAAKSLLMLPSEYFGTFDVVVVDLSESGPLSFEVSMNLTIFDSIARLVSPEGILIKNELYVESLSQIFDNTMLVFFEGVPLIHNWGLTLGSNRKDFLTRDPATMQKWHDIQTVRADFPASPLGLDDHFKFAHDYRKSDARAQGKCDSTIDTPSSSTPLAGILLILEAENASPQSGSLAEWSASADSTLSTVAKEVGLTPTSTNTYKFDDGKVIAALIMAEGVVIARTWPTENYVAFDVQMWSAFDKMKSLKKSLAKAVGSESLSSYRVITAGMRGTSTEAEDRKQLGPPPLSYRDCTAPELKASVINDETVEAAVEEGLKMVQGVGGAVAVLCGSEGKPCPSHNAISKNKDFPLSATLWTCLSVANFEYSSSNSEQTNAMLACEAEVVKQLDELVTNYGKLAAFVVDESAPINMVKIADRIWRSGRYRKRYLLKQFTFIATIKDPSETWRHDFLDLRRSELIDYGHLFRAEVVLKSSTTGSLEIGILSGQDTNFFGRLINVTTAIGERTGIETEIRHIEGGVEETYSFQDTIWYSEAHVDRRAGTRQFLEQRPLGTQHVLQLHVVEGKVSEPHILAALEAAQLDFEDVRLDTAHVGAGLVITSVSSLGVIVVVWDGEDRVDLNCFLYESLPMKGVMRRFSEYTEYMTTNSVKVETIVVDEMPRGTGRVVNVYKDAPQ